MGSAATPHRGGRPVGAPLTRLVARRRDLDLALRALSESRLVTFTGPGGVGKTRVALEVAGRARVDFPDGVWLVELAELGLGAGAADVDAATTSSLGIGDQSASPPRRTLLGFLRERNLLLLLDNCEHVLTPVRELLQVLLPEAPGVRVIVTSRAPLGIPGEVLRPVLPLSVPDPGTPAAELVTDGSVSLLLERARAVDPDFSLTDDNAGPLIELCRLLDGIPLAIELAAVKLRALTVDQVVSRFGHRLTTLSAPAGTSGPRHRSVRAMVEWSHELCSPAAQVLWRRTSVFPAGFDLDLAEAVCSFGELPEEDVVHLVEGLVSQSILLTERTTHGMRYRLPAPLREVAAELADRAGETAELQRHHHDALQQRAQGVHDAWCGPHQEALITSMRLDHAGYVAALQWSATTPGEAVAGLRLLARLRYHWLSGGLLAEGRMRLEALLAKAPGPSAERADCVSLLTWIALLQGDHAEAEECLADLTVLAAALDTPGLDAQVHQWRALLALFTGDPERAVSGFQVAIEEYRAAGEHWPELSARFMLASALLHVDRTSEALAVSADAVALCERHGDRSARAYALWAGGVAQWRLGHLDEAEQSAHAVLRLQRVLSDGICVALTTHLLACVAHDRRQTDRSATLVAAGRRIWRSLGSSLDAFGPQLAELVRQHTPPPSPAGPDDVPATGPFLDLQAVIALGLDGDREPLDARGAGQELTRREWEVAALVEDGLSNREIAQRLVIAKRTADGHVERILSKLGFTSRAQIAAWMARREKSHV